MSVAQDKSFKEKEQGEEAIYVREKEQAQLAALREQLQQTQATEGAVKPGSGGERDFEGGFGGQEDLEDRYATTSGEH
ncbi:hypothetical protein H0H92_013406 [Tricholoma furcatifolium]|nr:hypothetical protein H0H92_013406 [Tricholoma furcatifolium]